MSDTNFEDILGRGFDELPEPAPVPDGKYVLKGRYASAYKWESKEGEVGARIVLNDAVIKPADEATASAVESEDDYKGKSAARTFYVTNKEEERKVWDALAERGVEQEGTLESALKKFQGTVVVGTVKARHFTRKNGEAAFENQAVAYEAVSL